MPLPASRHLVPLLDGVVGGSLLVVLGVGVLWLTDVAPSVPVVLVLFLAGVCCGVVLGRDRRLVALLDRSRRGQASALQRTAQLNVSLADRVGAQSERLEASQRQLAAAQARALSHTLSAGVMHDLSNMLTLVSAAASELAVAADPVERDRAMDHLDHGLRQACDLLRSYRGLLRGQARVGQVEVRGAIDDLFPLLARTFPPDQHLRLRWEGPDELRAAMPDHELNQVIANLVINGRDALGEEAGEVELRALEEGGEVVVAVRDTGEGISPEVLQRAFEPFFTTKQDREGTGLGLHVIRELVRGAGGRVELSSEPGIGTTVVVRVPQVEPRSIADTEVA